MKLIGSKIEKILEENLKSRKEWLFSEGDGKYFFKILSQLSPGLKTAYVLQYSNILCCDKDIYTFITDKKEIYEIEISQINQEETFIVEQINFHEYKKALRGKNANLKLIIALKLIEEDLKSMKQE